MRQKNCVDEKKYIPLLSLKRGALIKAEIIPIELGLVMRSKDFRRSATDN